MRIEPVVAENSHPRKRAEPFTRNVERGSTTASAPPGASSAR